MRKIQLASILLLACFVCNAATMRVNKTFTNDTVLNLLNSQPLITSLAISGSVNFSSDIGLVRVILKNKSGAEYIVYESYPFCSPSKSFQFSGEAEETSILPDSKADGLYLIIRDASLTISNLEYTNTATGKSSQEIKAAQASATKIKAQQKISRINANMQLYNGEWTAGLGNFAALPFEDRKAFFGGTREYTIHGYEFYIGGIYSRARSSVTVMKSSSNSDLGADGFIKEFDWRKVHNAHLPTSPYFDGSPYRDGWATSVKNQLWNMPYRCGSCHIFAAVGLIEMYTNLYFNKHIDLDLSEQEMVSCRHLGCSGNRTDATLKQAKSGGLPYEDCFPYVGYETSCNNKCDAPSVVKISNWSKGFDEVFVNDNGFHYYTDRIFEDTEIGEIKKMLLEKGPMTGGYTGHAMFLVGWKTNSFNETAWIFKNSDGYSGSGEVDDGYHIAVHNDIGETEVHHFRNFISGSISGIDEEIRCVDLDGDGYYNWGIGPKPSSCHKCAPDIMDFNDNDPSVAEIDLATGKLKNTVHISLPDLKYTITAIQFFNGLLHSSSPCGNLIAEFTSPENNTFRGIHLTTRLNMLSTASFRVKNCTLKIIGGAIDNSNLLIQSGGHFFFADKAKLILAGGDTFTVEVGATGGLLETSFLVY
jgi:hypothetical protein